MDDMTTIDEDLAVYRQLADEYDNAAQRYNAAVEAGQIGVEAFSHMAALGEKLARVADELKGRIDAAQRAL
ncbi:hypothetical protein GCM10022268_28750 [Sphingomonas cynarae]|uniref:Uncharacterized protein n=2 Tax=Sphingomonas cynarae TaxID=930197 RepID=A0ABP7EHM8_9SPHN